MTREEFNTCVNQYSDGVFRFILHNLRDEDDARDIVQDSFIKLWDKSESIDPGKAKSYLFTTAYHSMIDHIRKYKRMQPLNVENNEFMMNNHSQRAIHENFDLKRVLNEALNKLPEIQRSVILLRDYENYSYEEIGKITNLSESQVKVYIYRGRMALKNYLVRMELVV